MSDETDTTDTTDGIAFSNEYDGSITLRSDNPKVTDHGDGRVSIRSPDGDRLTLDEEDAEWAALAVLRAINGQSVLLDAYTTVQERGRQYGPPTENWRVTADLKTAYDGNDQDAFDHAIQMVLVKAARLKTGNRDRDTLVDIAGYARGAAVVEGINDPSEDDQ